MRRWTGLVGLLLLEGLILGIRFDSDALDSLPNEWWAVLIRNTGALVRIGSVVVASLFLVAAARLRRGLSPTLARELRAHHVSPWLLLHLACYGGLAGLSAALFRGEETAPAHAQTLVIAWFLTLILTLGSWVLSMVPVHRLPAVARVYTPTLVLALPVGLVAAGFGRLAQDLWLPLRRVTYSLSSLLLHAFVRDVVDDPDNLAFGTNGFLVDIAPQCSGYEGVGLTWVFLLAALWLFRDRLRFPRAFWLLAIGTVVQFAVNIVRLVALVLVGAFVSSDIGAGGFHSYAGTLLFCAVALAIVALALRSPWFARGALAGAVAPASEGGAEMPAVNVAAPYLVPYMALIVAGLVSRAFSVGGWEPLYFLRPLLALAALGFYWRSYRQPAWRAFRRVSWLAVPVGLLAAAVWLGVDRLLPLEEAAASAPTQGAGFILRLSVRIATIVLIVPLVEELAFRGFLARRMMGPAFDTIPPPAITVVAVLASSLAFGLLHTRLVGGFLVGVCYALVFRARGSLADAVIAHAVTNLALLIITVAVGVWGLWM